MGGGGIPTEVTEADIAERYGWTFTELDNEDQDRVYAGFSGQNIRDCVNRIKGWLESGGKSKLSQSDMNVYGMMLEANPEALKRESKAEGVDEFLGEVKSQ